VKLYAKKCRCEEISPFYKLFEKINEKKQTDEVLKHLINAKEELVNALKSFIEKTAVKTKKTAKSLRKPYLYHCLKKRCMKLLRNFMRNLLQ